MFVVWPLYRITPYMALVLLFLVTPLWVHHRSGAPAQAAAKTSGCDTEVFAWTRYDTVAPGGLVEYFVKVTNVGNSTCEQVEAQVELPRSVEEAMSWVRRGNDWIPLLDSEHRSVECEYVNDTPSCTIAIDKLKPNESVLRRITHWAPYLEVTSPEVSSSLTWTRSSLRVLPNTAELRAGKSLHPTHTRARITVTTRYDMNEHNDTFFVTQKLRSQPIHSVAARFAPVLYLGSDDVKPIDVLNTLQRQRAHPQGLLRAVATDGRRLVAQPTTLHLCALGPSAKHWSVSLSADPVSQGTIVQQVVERAQSEPATVYSRVLVEGGWTIVQYWLYYPVSFAQVDGRWEATLLGDWESLTLFIPSADLDAIARGALEPEFVAYDQHGKAELRRWSEVKRSGARPHVYVARGSHASYFGVGEYTVARGVKDVVAPAYEVRDLLLQVFPTNDDALNSCSHPGSWLRFGGSWGVRLRDLPGLQPPRGPAFMDSWRDPVSWASRGKSGDNLLDERNEVHLYCVLPRAPRTGSTIPVYAVVSSPARGSLSYRLTIEPLSSDRFSPVEFFWRVASPRSRMLELQARTVWVGGTTVDGFRFVMKLYAGDGSGWRLVASQVCEYAGPPPSS